MTKDQCSAIIKAICKTAEYLAVVNLFDDKVNLFNDGVTVGEATQQALAPLNEEFEGDIDDIIADIPDDPADDTTPDDNQEET